MQVADSLSGASPTRTGGHLAALAALTPGDPYFQPGFESKDTSVQVSTSMHFAFTVKGCIDIYGISDLADQVCVVVSVFVIIAARPMEEL